MALMGWMIWFDLAGIATMFTGGQHGLLMNLSLAAIMMNGGLIGVAIGLATLGKPEMGRRPRTALTPATQANPS